MHNIHLDIQTKLDSKNDTALSQSCETGQQNMSGGSLTDEWRALQIRVPAVEPKVEKTVLEAWDTATTADNVFTPSHYAPVDGIECIDIMIQQYGLKRVQEWSEITSFKYQWRNGAKAGNSSTQDKMKSIWYTRFSIGDDPRND